MKACSCDLITSGHKFMTHAIMCLLSEKRYSESKVVEMLSVSSPYEHQIHIRLYSEILLQLKRLSICEHYSLGWAVWRNGTEQRWNLELIRGGVQGWGCMRYIHDTHAHFTNLVTISFSVEQGCYNLMFCLFDQLSTGSQNLLGH